MANKTIPELNEIDLVDVTADQLSIWDTGLETFKIRLSTLANFLLSFNRVVIEVVFDGVTTGATTVDVTDYVADAQVMQWMLKKPLGGSTFGEQLPATVIRTTDEVTVVIDTGDFALDAGTYVLIGV